VHFRPAEDNTAVYVVWQAPSEDFSSGPQKVEGVEGVHTWVQGIPSPESFDFCHGNATFWCVFIRRGTKFKSL